MTIYFRKYTASIQVRKKSISQMRIDIVFMTDYANKTVYSVHSTLHEESISQSILVHPTLNLAVVQKLVCFEHVWVP